MIFHGIWTGDDPSRPALTARLICKGRKSKKYEGSLDFLIDTASDRTFIVPAHQRILGIPKSELISESKPVNTITGPVIFRFAPAAVLVFREVNGTTHSVNVRPYFGSATQSNWLARFLRRGKDWLIGEGKDYSIIGLDVLREFAIGCCNPEDVLFLTKLRNRFSHDLQTNFARPQLPISWKD